MMNDLNNSLELIKHFFKGKWDREQLLPFEELKAKRYLAELYFESFLIKNPQTFPSSFHSQRNDSNEKEESSRGKNARKATLNKRRGKKTPCGG